MYLHDNRVLVGVSRKLQSIYSGPYLVTRVLSQVLYCIRGRKREVVVHHDRLKPCCDRFVPLWLRKLRHEFLNLDGPFIGGPGTDNADLPDALQDLLHPDVDPETWQDDEQHTMGAEKDSEDDTLGEVQTTMMELRRHPMSRHKSVGMVAFDDPTPD